MKLTEWLAAQKALAEKATPGPWEVLGDGGQAFSGDGMVAKCDCQWADDYDEEGLTADEARAQTNAAFIASARTSLPLALRLVEVLYGALVDCGEHQSECLLSQWSAGRPTDDGGYESCYAGVWYETKPRDMSPPCTCGLNGAFAECERIIAEGK